MMFIEKIKPYDIVLVSQSPRRRELLAGLEIDFTSCSVDIDESYPENLEGVQIPLFIAEAKAQAYMSKLNDKTIAITADTIVNINNTAIGKPENKQQAKAMLQELSGKTHKVITAVCLFNKNKQRSFHVITDVTFAVLSEEEIDYYIEKYNPLDKAGSYGVQEWIGYVGIEKLVGSYYNVMGLPVHRLYKELINFIK